MKKKNAVYRLICLICVLSLLIPILPGAGAYGIASGWAKPELNRMEELGLIPDSLNDAPTLKRPITRQEMCELAALAYETFYGRVILVREPTPFRDTTSPAVAKAYALGIVSGYGDGTVGAEDGLTREQFFSITVRFMNLLGSELKGGEEELEFYLDKDAISSWARSDTASVVRVGIAKGSAGYLTPKDYVTCEQALAMFCRAYEIQLTGGYQEPARLAGAKSWARSELTEMDGESLIPALLLYDNLSGTITRREMAYVAVKVYYSILGREFNETRTSPFLDVNDPVVTAAYYSGLVSGKGSGLFGPDDPVTREQLFTMTANLLMFCGFDRIDAPNVDLNKFSDGEAVSDYAKAGTRLLLDLGIISGSSGSSLSPAANADRQTALLLFYRARNTLNDWLKSLMGDTSLGQQIADYALQFVGYNYVWAGDSPSDGGFDCSGLIVYVFGHFDIPMYHGATGMWNGNHAGYAVGREIAPSEMMPGDLIFFSYDHDDYMDHVAIYVGNNQFLHAANTSRGVVVDTITWGANTWFGSRFAGVKRFY